MKFKSEVQLEALNNATVDTDKFLVSDSTTVKYRTGAQVLSDLGVSGIYVPYTGATGNVDLGTHTLLAKDLIINHSSGSGVAASITKNGSGEALTIIKGSGSGNAMSVTGGLTSLVDLSLSTVANATGDFLTHSGSTIHKRTPSQVLSDIGGQAALTNPITGTGTINYISKFTGSTSLGNSIISEVSGVAVSIAGNVSVNGNWATTYPIYQMIDTRIGGAEWNIENGRTIGNLEFYNGAAGGTKLTLTPSGNVGIGTTIPDSKLTSLGNIKVGNALDNSSQWIGKSSSGTETFRGAIKFLSTTTDDIIQFNTHRSGVSSDIRMTIDGIGNVGIGTASPAWKLDVSGVGRFRDANTYEGAFIEGTNGIAYFGSLAADAISLYSGGVSRVYINSNGNVGIGTTSPARTLHVLGQTGIGTVLKLEGATGTTTYLQLSYNGATNSQSGYIGYDSSSNMSLFTNDSERMRITSGGNVGIGTTSPFSNAKLQIRPSSDVNIAFQPSTGLSNGGKINAFDDTASVNVNLEINGLNLGFKTNESERMRIASNGAIKFNSYGSGSFTGTATQRLAVDSSGNVIEIPIGSGAVDGSGTTNYVTKWTDADTIGNSQIFDNGANVGIGTNIPSAAFQVGNGTGLKNILISGSGNNLGLGGLSVSFLGFATGTISTVNTSGAVPLGVGTRSTQPLVLGTNNAERMRIDSSGNVGIGTTSPQTLLQLGEGSLSNATTNQYLRVNAGGYNALSYAHLDLFNFGNNFGNSLGWRLTSGTEGAGVSVGRYLSFNTVVTDGSGNPSTSSERMRITSGGNVGIGTTSPGAKLDVDANGYSIIANNGYGNRSLYLGTNGGEPSIQATLSNGSPRQLSLNPSGGNVGIGTTSPNASAILHLKSNSKGFLPPSMSTADRDNIGSPLAGLMIFNKEDEVIQVFTNGSGWKTLAWA
jgi:hypothetical protein